MSTITPENKAYIDSVYSDYEKYKQTANETFIYLVKKYAPDRQDLIDKLQNTDDAYNYVKYYLGEISRANNWKTNYSPDDQRLVYDLFFYFC